MMKGIKGIKNIRESFKTRQVKYGGYAVLITLAVLVGLVLLNLMAGQFSPQVDLTDTKIYSLSEPTLQVLDKITSPVKFYGLWRPGEERQDIITVINHCLQRNSNLTLEVIDPDRNPGFVKRYETGETGIVPGSLIVEREAEGKRVFKLISLYDMYDISQNQQGQTTITGVAVERRITSALLFVGTGTTPVVYEIAGHSEIPFSGLPGMTELFERENLSLKPLNLLASIIPADASALILNAPRQDLAPVEAERLLDYLEQGGRLLVMADYTMGELSNLNTVLSSYGLNFDYGIVFETDSTYVDPYLQMSEKPDMAGTHDITKNLTNKNDTPLLLLGAMSLSELATKRRTVEITPLMTSSPAAFLRTNLDLTSPSKIASDIQGPLTLAAAVTDPYWIDPNNPVPQARIVAIGCASLLPIAVQLQLTPNSDFFMNSLVWLEDRPESITAQSKSLYIGRLNINGLLFLILAGLFVVIIPLAFIVTGLVTWLKRRHL